MSFRLSDYGETRTINLQMNIGEVSEYNADYTMDFTNTAGTTSYLVKDKSEHPNEFLTFNFKSGVSNLILRLGGVYFNDIKMDETGQYQVVHSFDNSEDATQEQQLWRSDNYGKTWNSGVTDYDFTAISVNGDGTKMLGAARNFGVVESVDYGETWSFKSSNLYSQDISMNKTTGQYVLLGASNDFLKLSKDGGTTWTDKLTTHFWNAVDMSETGQYQLAGAASDDIYVSNDYGETFTALGIIDRWETCSVSATGQYMIAAVGTDITGSLYVSSDYGVSFTLKTVKGYWLDTAMSADGRIMYATAHGHYSEGDYIYTSDDFGETFTAGTELKSWKGIDCSTNGKQIALIVNDILYRGNLYSAYNTQIYLEVGWYSYILKDTDEKTLKNGQCYVYNSENAGNSADNTAIHTEIKEKYVYNRA
jgi:hypothetical protein